MRGVQAASLSLQLQEHSACFLPARGLSLTAQLGARPAVPHNGVSFCQMSAAAGRGLALL